MNRNPPLVFSDIDGTLLTSSHELGADTLQAIQWVDRLGVPFILVSSRSPQAMYPIQQQLGTRGPMVSYGGALVLDQDGNALLDIGFSPKTAAEIKGLIAGMSLSICCTAYASNHWMVDNLGDPWVAQEQRNTGAIPEEGAVEQHPLIHKLLCMGHPKSIAAIEQVLSQRYPQLTICRSKDTYLEIVDGSASKANAVAFLCNRLGCKMADAISFGDNYNDVDMLRATGTGVAMGNAPDPVKKIASMITLDNDHNGVGTALNRIFCGYSRYKEVVL